jgi:hypothetical protein
MRRQALGYPHLSSARQSATASVEKIFLLAPGTFRLGIMLMNFTGQGLKGVKDVPNGKTNRARQSVRIFLALFFEAKLDPTAMA